MTMPLPGEGKPRLSADAQTQPTQLKWREMRFCQHCKKGFSLDVPPAKPTKTGRRRCPTCKNLTGTWPDERNR